MKLMRRSGFTLVELMIVVAVIAVVASIAIPSLQAARKSANETRAISFLRTASTVNEQYRTRYQTYPVSELDLFASGLMAPGQGPKGYVLSFTTTPFDWALRADPEQPGLTGDRYFYIDATGVIRFSTTAPALPTDTPLD